MELRRLTSEVEDLGEELADEVNRVGDEAENMGDKVESAVQEVNAQGFKIVTNNLLKKKLDSLSSTVREERTDMNIKLKGLSTEMTQLEHLLQELQQQLTVISRETQDIKAILQPVCNASNPCQQDDSKIENNTDHTCTVHLLLELQQQLSHLTSIFQREPRY